MSKILVIAEKPEVANDITKAIIPGAEKKNGYFMKATDRNTVYVTSAFGHLMELVDPDEYDESYKEWVLEDLPLKFDNWKIKPAKDDYKKARLSIIGKLLKEVDEVVCAGDPDDEGQLLIDEIIDYFGFRGKCYRVFINDNMEANIKKEFKNLKNNDDYRCLSKAASARRMADKCFGINESRLAGIKLNRKGLAIGRVQTPTLGLVVARDEAIENHVKEKYYEMSADVKVGDVGESPFKFKPDKKYMADNDLQYITNKEFLETIGKYCDGKTFKVNTEEKNKTSAAQLPYNLTALQSDMNKRFGYSAAKTLDLTQSLRSKKAITYNRSDSRYLKEEHYNAAPALFKTVLSGTLISKYNLDFSRHSLCFNDANVTAHHGIIPQAVNINPETLPNDEKNIYMAIVERYAQQFMQPLKQTVSTSVIELKGKQYTHALEHVCAKTVDPGYTAYFGKEKEDEENEKGLYIPAGTYDGLVLKHKIDEKETKPPAKYTEGTLVKDMSSIAKYVTDPEIKAILKRKDEGKKGENGSIGTVATRSAIIENLIKRNFFERKGKNIVSTELGRRFYHILPPEISKADTTAKWWLIQEDIKEGKEENQNAIQQSVCEEFLKHMDTAYSGATLAGIKGQEVKEKHTGTWNGEQVTFNKEWGGHTFTDDELESLLAGEKITFEINGREVSGVLAKQKYKGQIFVGFLMDRVDRSEDEAYATGTWKKKKVSFKREWGGHTFTEDEITKLLDGETISFTAKSKAGKDYTATGCLANQTYNGSKFVGFKPDFGKTKKK